MPKSTVILVMLLSTVCWGAEPQSSPPTAGEGQPQSARKNVKLPGLVVNMQKRYVDLEATVCLDEGMLELVACAKGSKEHESIVAVESRPMHIHAALLLLGANPGNPAMARRVGEGEEARWVHLPPRGDPVEVYLVLKDKDGNLVERPVSRFVTRSDEGADAPLRASDTAPEEQKFPNTFVFAGSQLCDNGPGSRRYLADQSGDVISIATFGDELLCLSGFYSNENAALMWQVDATELPKVGTNVTLRLRPQVKPAAKAGDTPGPDKNSATR